MPQGLRLLLVLASLAVVGGLFFVLRPKSSSPPAQPASPSASERQEAERPNAKIKPRLKVYRVRVSGGKPVGGVRTLAYRKGERAKLVFTSSSPLEVHLHGYDREASGGPGRPAVISLRASLEGRFEVEDHGSGSQLALLEVRP